MSKNLVIVESPAKARTIEKYLGKGFEVLASYGHVRDLVPKEAFESANELYLFGNAKLSRAASRRNRFAVLNEIVERCQQLMNSAEFDAHVDAVSAG